MAAITTRLYIVCTAAERQVVNDTLSLVDPTSVGDAVSAPLVELAGTTVVGYGASWAMQDATAAALRTAVRQAGWQPRPTASEQTVWTAATLASVPAWLTQRVYVFQGPHWDPAQATPFDVSWPQVLSTLGLRPLPSDRP